MITVEKTKKIIIALAILISSSVPFSYFVLAQSAEDEALLEQLSEEDLQKLESQIESIISSPTVFENASRGNDFPLDIVWKANTYIPEDYKGKALPGVETTVSIHAIANTKNPGNLKYTWIIEDTSSFGQEGPNLSGTGKDTFGFVTQRIREFKHEITVTAQNEETNELATVRFEIQTVLPEVNLYILHNGNYNNLAPQSVRLRKSDESGLMARVFYLKSNGVNNIDFIWKLNGEKKENEGPKPYIIPITIANRTEVGTYFELKTEAINKKMDQNIYERAKKTATIKIIE